MNYRTNAIQAILNRWLARYSPPASMKENPEATRDEVEALLRILMRFAPAEDYEGWINDALDRCAMQMKTRSWPTMGELGAVCSNKRKSDNERKGRAEKADAKSDSVEISAQRMASGEPVGEGYLYGRHAVEMIARGLVTRETMDRYRSAAFLSRREMYGQEAALEWEAEAKARHEAGKELWRSRKDEKSKRDVSGYFKQAIGGN